MSRSNTQSWDSSGPPIYLNDVRRFGDPGCGIKQGANRSVRDARDPILLTLTSLPSESMYLPLA